MRVGVSDEVRWSLIAKCRFCWRLAPGFLSKRERPACRLHSKAEPDSLRYRQRKLGAAHSVYGSLKEAYERQEGREKQVVPLEFSAGGITPERLTATARRERGNSLGALLAQLPRVTGEWEDLAQVRGGEMSREAVQRIFCAYGPDCSHRNHPETLDLALEEIRSSPATATSLFLWAEAWLTVEQQDGRKKTRLARQIEEVMSLLGRD